MQFSQNVVKYAVNFFLFSTFCIWNYSSTKAHENGVDQDTNFNFHLLRHFENEYWQFSSHNFSKDDTKACFNQKNHQIIMLDLIHLSVSQADQSFVLFGLDEALYCSSKIFLSLYTTFPLFIFMRKMSIINYKFA